MMNWFKRMTNRININGVDFVVGRNVTINGTTVMVDGKIVDANVSASQQKLEVRVLEGTIENLRADGSVSCGDVTGSINCGGSANVDGNVGGSVNSGGSANIDGSVGGSISAGGSVRVGR